MWFKIAKNTDAKYNRKFPLCVYEKNYCTNEPKEAAQNI